MLEYVKLYRETGLTYWQFSCVDASGFNLSIWPHLLRCLFLCVFSFPVVSLESLCRLNTLFYKNQTKQRTQTLNMWYFHAQEWGRSCPDLNPHVFHILDFHPVTFLSISGPNTMNLCSRNTCLVAPRSSNLQHKTRICCLLTEFLLHLTFCFGVLRCLGMNVLKLEMSLAP